MKNIDWSWVRGVVILSLLVVGRCDASPKREELINLVDLAIKNEDYENAVRKLEVIMATPSLQTVSTPKWWAPLYFKKGWCELKLKEWRDASLSFERCHKVDQDLKSNPYHLEALRGWARAEASLQNYETSIKLLKHYTQKTSNFDWEAPFQISDGGQSKKAE